MNPEQGMVSVDTRAREVGRFWGRHGHLGTVIVVAFSRESPYGFPIGEMYRYLNPARKFLRHLRSLHLEGVLTDEDFSDRGLEAGSDRIRECVRRSFPIHEVVSDPRDPDIPVAVDDEAITAITSSIREGIREMGGLRALFRT